MRDTGWGHDITSLPADVQADIERVREAMDWQKGDAVARAIFEKLVKRLVELEAQIGTSKV